MTMENPTIWRYLSPIKNLVMQHLSFWCAFPIDLHCPLPPLAGQDQLQYLSLRASRSSAKASSWTNAALDWSSLLRLWNCFNVRGLRPKNAEVGGHQSNQPTACSHNTSDACHDFTRHIFGFISTLQQLIQRRHFAQTHGTRWGWPQCAISALSSALALAKPSAKRSHWSPMHKRHCRRPEYTDRNHHLNILRFMASRL